MSYIQRQGLGSVIGTVSDVLQDPCLSQVYTLVQEFPGGGGGGPGAPGIGLCKTVTPIRTAVWMANHPYASVGLAIGFIGGLMMVGASVFGGRR